MICFVCSKRINKRQDASYHGNGVLFKHRSCFSRNISNPVYHRRLIAFEEDDSNILYNIAVFKKFGANILWYNTEHVFMIYPDSFPEILIKYHGDIITTDFWGITGIRKEVKELLPRKYKEEAIPEYMFRKAGYDEVCYRPFKMPAMKKINSDCWWKSRGVYRPSTLVNVVHIKSFRRK